MPRLLPATEHTAWAGAHAPGALLPRASWTTDDSGGGAGESEGLTKMAATMERFVAVVKEEYHSVVCYIKQENTHSECT